MRLCAFCLYLLSCFGCSSTTTYEVGVVLRTDLVPLEEFVMVRTTIESDTREIERRDRLGERGDDFISGELVLSANNVAKGNYKIRVRVLSLGGDIIASRTVIATVQQDHMVRVLLPRSSTNCDEARCEEGETCVGSECVDLRCSPDQPSYWRFL